MNQFKSSLSKVSAVALVLGLAACAHNNPSAQGPQNPAEQQPSTSEQYGSAMGQQGATGNAMGQPGTPSGTAGTEPGAQGTSGAASGAPGEPGGAYGQQQGAGAYGQQGGGAQGMQPGTPQGGAYGSGGQGMPAPGTSGAEYGAGGGGAGAGGGPMGAGDGATGDQGGMGQTGGPMDVSTLNDSQIAAILQTIDADQLQESQLAESKARSPEVKRFARDMVNAHRQMQGRENALFQRLQITPSPNPVSQQLRSDAQTRLSNLQSMRGNDFDQAYLADEVREHNNHLELLDRAIPNVKNPDLKSDLQNVRAKIAAHLADAERIQATLQKGSTNTRGGQGNQPSGNQGQGQPNQP
jgi:putative membrane protein